MSLAAGLSAAQASGTGCVISIGGPTGSTGSETFIPIGEISDAKFSGQKRAVTPTTSFDSLGIARKLGTILDFGSFTCTAMRVGNNAGQTALIAANLANGAYDFKITLPINPLIGQTTAGDVITFAGIVTQAGSLDISISKATELTFEVDLISYSVAAGS